MLPMQPNSSVNVEVTRGPNESTANVIRRFTKRIQGSGILPRVRGIRYRARTVSPYVRKKKALKAIKGREKFNELVKLGKVELKPERR